MYDEKMIEDSLAFAEEIRARLEGKKAGESSSRPVQSKPVSQTRPVQQTADQKLSQQQAMSAQTHSAQKAAARQIQPGQPMSSGTAGQGQMKSMQGNFAQSVRTQQSVSRQTAMPQAQEQNRPAQRDISGQTRRSQQTQPVRSQQPQSGQAVMPQAPGQSRPMQQNMSGQVTSAQQPSGQIKSRQNIQPQSVSGQTRRPQQTQPARSQQLQSGQAVMPKAPGQSRPVQQNVSGQTAAASVSDQSRPVQQNMAGQVTSAQQPSGQIKSGQNIQPQSVSGQVMRAQQTQQAGSQQLQSGRAVVPQAPGQSRPIQQNTSGQPVSPAQSQSHPVQQNMSGQTASVQPVASNPAGQPASMQQSVLPQGQITRQSIPDQTPIPSVDGKVTEAQQPELQQAEVPKPEKPQKEHLISVSTSTSRPVRSKSSALETISEETKPMDEEQDHTVEITIKLDVAGIKKKFSDLKKKLAPEERTLEDVNAAMEQNRQLQAEKQQENSETAAQKGAELAHKAASTASGIGKKVTGLLRKRQESAATLEGEAVTAEGEMINPVDGQAVDGQIVQLEGEAVEENRFAEKIQDLKEVIPQKAGKASHLLTNIIIIAFCIGIAYFLASFVTNYVAYQTPVEGESMEPTLTDGDSVVIQRLSYYFTDPKRYDVVVFPVNYDSESQEKTYYIKRVIGLPGETVQIIDGSVYINNEKLTDDKYSSTTINEAGIAENPLVLGENQYFVMGDNRNMSTDSRNSYVGLVNKNDIVGEAWICTWPLTHFGGLK